MKALIIDGYVDEPSCLGVPPYLSPYPRYIAGALRERGLHEKDIHYYTIDTLRENPPGYRGTYRKSRNFDCYCRNDSARKIPSGFPYNP